MKVDILDVHKACLDLLLECQINDDKFFFVPRKINNKNRLEQGMYFRGNENYLVLSFWDSTDTKEFIYNINWSCDNNGVSSIELSCRDNDAVLPYVVAIKELLELSGKKFKETKKNRWRYFYPEKEHYLSTLQKFIINEKPLIDEYLKQHSESGIPLANNDTNDKYVKKLPCYTSIWTALKKLRRQEALM